MIRGNVLHYVQRDGDKEVHIIPDGGVYDVYYVKDGSCLNYAYGLPRYQPTEKKYYGLDEVFTIAWSNFSTYEEMNIYEL